MSKTKKILSIVLAVVMAFSVFSICAFADTPTATWTIEVTNTDGSALPASIPTGTQVKVTVKLQTNFYVGTVGLPVYFSSAFDYVDSSAVQEAIYGTGATRFGFNDDYTADTGYKAVYAVYVPDSGNGATSPMYSTATTVLTFVLEATSEATAVVKLDGTKQKSKPDNIGGPFYCGSRDSADVSTDEATVGQTFNVPAATEVVIADVVADPELQGVGTGCVDQDNSYVYGVPANTATSAFGSYFTATNGGKFSVSANGTGATLTLMRADDSVVKTYTLIIFGDINGDGVVSLADLSAMGIAIENSSLTGAFKVAGDINGDGSTTNPIFSLADLSAMGTAIETGGVSVNPYA